MVVRPDPITVGRVVSRADERAGPRRFSGNKEKSRCEPISHFVCEVAKARSKIVIDKTSKISTV